MKFYDYVSKCFKGIDSYKIFFFFWSKTPVQPCFQLWSIHLGLILGSTSRNQHLVDGCCKASSPWIWMVLPSNIPSHPILSWHLHSIKPFFSHLVYRLIKCLSFSPSTSLRCYLLFSKGSLETKVLRSAFAWVLFSAKSMTDCSYAFF